MRFTKSLLLSISLAMGVSAMPAAQLDGGFETCHVPGALCSLLEGSNPVDCEWCCTNFFVPQPGSPCHTHEGSPPCGEMDMGIIYHCSDEH